MMFTKKPEREPEKSVPQQRPPESRIADPAPPAPSTPFRKAEQVRGSGNMAPSIIGEDLTVTGNIVSKGEVQIEGEVQGDIHCTSLVIGDKAQVSGGVVADDVVVRGSVSGSIRGIRVTLQSSSHVEGDVFHESLAIEQGAFFEGKSRRADEPTAVTQDRGSSASQMKDRSSSTSLGNDDKKSDDDSSPKAPRAAE